MENNNNPLMTLLVGAITAVVVALIWAGLSIWMESEYAAIMALGMALIGGAVRMTVPEKSVLGAMAGTHIVRMMIRRRNLCMLPVKVFKTVKGRMLFLHIEL